MLRRQTRWDRWRNKGRSDAFGWRKPQSIKRARDECHIEKSVVTLYREDRFAVYHPPCRTAALPFVAAPIQNVPKRRVALTETRLIVTPQFNLGSE